MTATYPAFDKPTVEFLEFGLASRVNALDDQTIIKALHEDADEADIKSLVTEKRIFQRLTTPHPSMVRCLEITDEGVIMERLHQSLRQFLSNTLPTTVSLSRRL